MWIYIAILTPIMVLTFPLKSVGSWESCYAFNPGPEFQKMLIFFPSLGSFSSAGDKKLSLLSLIVEKPEHPQCRDSSVCTTVLYFTIVKSLLILFRTCSYSSMEKKKKAYFLQMSSSPICITHFEICIEQHMVVKRKVLQDPLKL